MQAMLCSSPEPDTPQTQTHSTPIDCLPPIRLPPKSKISHRIAKSLYQASDPRQPKPDRKVMNYSMRRKNYDNKYLQEYLRQENRKNGAISLQRSALHSKPKEDATLSAKLKMDKLKIPQIRPALKSMKDQYKIREQSIQQFLSHSAQLDNYKLLSHLGKGSFSVVSLAVSKQTNKRFAIKTYAKVNQIEDYKFDNIYREISNLRQLQHHNIVNLFHVVKDKRKLMLIMEDGGKLSLAGLMRKTKVLTEATAKPIFRQLVQAVGYCHDKRICHRDLKLQNILIDQANLVKVIDFGFSSKCGQKLSNYCGTPPYMAPEITLKAPYYGQPADMWALGVILYLMLCGKFPFRAASEKELYRLIQQGKFQMGEAFSPQLKEFLSKLLRCNAKERPTAEQALACTWLS